jgi:hypothetical protein
VICEELKKRDAKIKRLKAELEVMKGIVPMTDSQREAFIESVIRIGEELK